MINISELNKICEDLSSQYNSEVTVKVTDLPRNFNGKFNYFTSEILINSDIIDQELAVCTVYHEFRHAWQLKNYPDLFHWWISHYDIYMDYYDTPINSMESDAILFGYSHGKKNREDLLDFYRVEDLENLFQNNMFELALEHLEYLERQRGGD